jgi:hypothetical protein
MRPVQFIYSIDYHDWLGEVSREFDAWLDRGLAHGGVNDVHVDYKILDLIERFVPSSPRQLMELGMQCEALLGIEIEDEIFGYKPADAYEALRIAISRFVASELETHWDERKLTSAHPLDLTIGANGNGTGAAGDEAAEAN